MIEREGGRDERYRRLSKERERFPLKDAPINDERDGSSNHPIGKYATMMEGPTSLHGVFTAPGFIESNRGSSLVALRRYFFFCEAKEHPERVVAVVVVVVIANTILFGCCLE